MVFKRQKNDGLVQRKEKPAQPNLNGSFNVWTNNVRIDQECGLLTGSYF